MHLVVNLAQCNEDVLRSGGIVADTLNQGTRWK